MSHSQFHCTGRAYLDMHGLIFETSICYWQDQPGRGKRARRRGAGRAGGGGGKRREPGRRPAPPREVRKPGGRGGVGREGRSPGRETRPPRSRPRRGCPTARRALGSARVAARRRHRAGGTRGRAGVVRREEEGGGPPSFLPPPPRPARATTTGTADARPRRPSVHPPQSGAGEAGRRGHGDRPAGGGRDRGPVPRSGERIGAGAPPRPARDDGGGGGGGDTGDGSGPRRAREARHTGAHGPGEQQTARGPRRTDGRRGAPTGCGRAGPTPRNRWRRWGGRAPPRGERPKATRRRGRESAAGAHRGISPPEALPAQGRSRGTTRDDDGLAPPPSRGSRPPPPPPPEPQPARGEHSPAAHRRPPPPRPSRAPGSPPRPPRSGLPRALLRPGTPPARQRPGDDTHVRRGEAGSGPGRGRERGRSHARDEGEDEAGGGGEGPASTHGGGRGTGTRAPPRGPDDKGRARGRAPRNTSAGSHRHPHARAVPRRLGRRPAPAIPGAWPTTRPRRHGRRAVHPSSAIHPRRIRLSI